MRLLRAAVIGIVGAAAVLLAPGAAAADSAAAGSGAVPRDCERIWIWWIPFPCRPE
jgi:hypothetical protein